MPGIIKKVKRKTENAEKGERKQQGEEGKEGSGRLDGERIIWSSISNIPKEKTDSLQG